ncbi:MAG: porin [Alphaproteobacteria bacterium]
MKKYLLSAVFLTASFPFTAAAQTATVEAFDQPVELQLGGYMTWYGTYTNQKRTTLKQTGPASATPIGEYNNFDLMGDAEIYFSGSTTLRNDVKISVMIQLEAGTDSDTSDQTIDETYMMVDSKIGRIIAGNVKNVSNQMSVTSPNVSTLGVQETDFRRVLIAPAGFSYNKATYAVLDDISTKLSYITPTVSGFTAGISLMPGNKKKGKDADNLLIPSGGIKLFKYGADAAALFRHDFGSFDLEAGTSYTVYKPNLRANGEWAKEKNINEYGAGLNIGFGNWSVGGSYHYTNISRETAEFLNPYANVAKGNGWDAGVKFSAGPFAASANVFQSRADSLTVDGKKDIFSMYQLSAQYKILAGIDLFADLAYLDFKSASDERGLSNKGPAAAIGMNLNF